jgi:hypothetical protein
MSHSSWLAAIRRYLIAATCGNLVWETAQLALYTLWHNGTASSITGAVLHCTAGDVLLPPSPRPARWRSWGAPSGRIGVDSASPSWR